MNIKTRFSLRLRRFSNDDNDKFRLRSKLESIRLRAHPLFCYLTQTILERKASDPPDPLKNTDTVIWESYFIAMDPWLPPILNFEQPLPALYGIMKDALSSRSLSLFFLTALSSPSFSMAAKSWPHNLKLSLSNQTN